MKEPCVLLSGPVIALDDELVRQLKQFAVVVRNFDQSQIAVIVEQRKADLILLEISDKRPDEIEMIKTMKDQFPLVEIIIIDGNGDHELRVEAFAHGARDAFRKPYKCKLVAERVNALLPRSKPF